MCGIACVYNFGGNIRDKGMVKKMIHAQRHRGPDDEGYFFDENVHLGHCRLSIIDLSQKAHQPMPNHDRTKWIIFNGEIYNYIEIRKELEGLGYSFESSSDTEVILKAYEAWQERSLNKFNGMWAIVIWDAVKKELFVARDRFGVKPVYYRSKDEFLLISSEIKGLLASGLFRPETDDRAVFDYLVSGYGYMDTSDNTFFKDVYKLPAGHYMKISAGSKVVSPKKFYDIKDNIGSFHGSFEKAMEMFGTVFEDAVKLRLRSDVPVGVALSGGIDSSSIACVADLLSPASLSSFSSVFSQPEADERSYIEEVLSKTRLRGYFVTPPADTVFQDMEQILWHQEEPYSTLSILPQWHVMRSVREKGVKVLMTGQGGDETLGGYHKYYLYLFAELLMKLKVGAAVSEICAYKAVKPGHKGLAGDIARIMLSYAMPAWMKSLLSGMSLKKPFYMDMDFFEKFNKRSPVKRAVRGVLNNDLYHAFGISPLPALLHADDRSSMAHSIETRSPFLDYRLVEFAFSMPADFKIHDGVTKYVLRKTMRGTVPDMLLDRKDKMGFPTPIRTWMQGELKHEVEDILNSRAFLKRSYFDHKKLKQLEGAGRLNGEENLFTVWNWVNLELWMRKFIDNTKV